MFWHDSGNDDMDLSSSNRNQTNAEGMLKQGAAAVVILTDPRWEQSAEQGAERSTAGKHKPANKTHSNTIVDEMAPPKPNPPTLTRVPH